MSPTQKSTKYRIRLWYLSTTLTIRTWLLRTPRPNSAVAQHLLIITLPRSRRVVESPSLLSMSVSISLQISMVFVNSRNGEVQVICTEYGLDLRG